MFELKYGLTAADIKAAGKKANLKYIVLYLLCAAVGLAVGITAVVVRPSTLMFVAGIIIIVLCAFLTMCALLLLFAKTALESVVPTDVELNVTVTHDNISVEFGDEQTEFMYESIIGVRRTEKFVTVFFDKTKVLLIKNIGGVNMQELYQYIEKRMGRALPPSMTENSETVANTDNADTE